MASGKINKLLWLKVCSSTVYSKRGFKVWNEMWILLQVVWWWCCTEAFKFWVWVWGWVGCSYLLELWFAWGVWVRDSVGEKIGK